jgi:CheY-specific phosphatase CheX
MSEDRELLVTVFSRVAEELAFMFTDTPDPDDVETAKNVFVKAHMRFKGPINGTLNMIVPESMCPQIAANVLGLDPTDEMFLQAPHDAVKELLNVTCGNLLTEMAGEDPVFDLLPPEVSILDRSAWLTIKKHPNTVLFAVDDEPVLLYLEKD